MNIFDIVTSKNIVAYWETNSNLPPYDGERFFPSKKQVGLTFEMIKGKQGTPVALVSSAFDTNVLYRDRIGLTELRGKLPFFKEATKIDEELRQKLLTYNDNYAQQLLPIVFDDLNGLLDGAEVTVERMRMQLLSTGTIAIKENGVDKAYDYGFKSATQSVTETTLWSADGAKPYLSLVKQIKNYKKLTKKTAAIIIISDTAFSYLENDATILDVFAKASIPNPAPTTEEIKSYLERRLGVTFLIQDKTYKKARDFAGDDVRFYPENCYTILPNEFLGETLYGTTPEEADLVSGNSKAGSAVVTGKGVAVTTWNEVDPVNINTKVSEVVAPTCPNIDLIYIVKVTA